jgi:exodeoxyribonuclease-3
MRVITLNINGIRAGARKGFFDWVQSEKPDVICLQETKAQMAHLKDHDNLCLPGYHAYYHDAERKGYSGVGILTRVKPTRVVTGLGFPVADTEGRYIQCDFGDLSIVSLYMPSGSSSEDRQVVKFDFMAHYEKILHKQVRSGRSFIVCGDWNIVHKEIDIKNFKSNQKNSGCLPEERAWIDQLFVKEGWVDAFRQVNQASDEYTWWSQRMRAREKNVGWRIDYQVVTPDLGPKVRAARIYKDQVFSDHAPVIIDYALTQPFGEQ